jgi:hypothetical protein
MKNNKIFYFNYLLIIIIIILLSILIFTKTKRESFENTGMSIFPTFDMGESGKATTGKINFKKSFSKIPTVFTQIISKQNNNNLNVYSVQIYNINNNGFEYSKNKAYNNTINTDNIKNMKFVKIDPSTEETFLWIAF